MYIYRASCRVRIHLAHLVPQALTGPGFRMKRASLSFIYVFILLHICAGLSGALYHDAVYLDADPLAPGYKKATV